MCRLAHIPRRLRFALGWLPRPARLDQERVRTHARHRGIAKYDFSQAEYERLRQLAVQLHLQNELIAEFDRDFRFMHECPRLMRTGRFSAITGMCYDIAIQSYAEIACTIERTERTYNHYVRQ